MDLNNGNDKSLKVPTNGEKSCNYNVSHKDVVPESETRSETETRHEKKIRSETDTIEENIFSVIPQESVRTDGGCLSGSRQRKDMDGMDGDKHSVGGLPIVERIVKRSLQVIKGPYFYKMSGNRGKFIFVNNYDFVDKSVMPRLGAESETEYLSNIFTQLGFEVVLHENISAAKMLLLFEEVSTDQSLVNHDSLFVMIMTHGEKGLLMGSDCIYVSVEDIIKLFIDSNCTQLIHKPKVFFINACRGGAFDYGIIDPESAADAGVPRPSPFADTGIPILPTSSDTLICYSTVEGYVSLRYDSTGSWFGDALGSVLVDHACEDDLETLLKRVNNRMLRRDSRITSNRTKQALEVVFRGWGKKLYFNPGLYEC